MEFAITVGMPEKVEEMAMDAEWAFREVMETVAEEDLAISAVTDKVVAIVVEEGMGINKGTDKGIKVSLIPE